MAEVLVLVDHVDGQVRKVTAELLTLARSLGTPSAVFVGSNVDAARPRLAQFGAEKVYVIDSAEVDGHPAPLAEALAAVVEQASPASTLTASVVRPELVLTARRAAASLFVPEEGRRIADGEACSTTAASASASGAG